MKAIEAFRDLFMLNLEVQNSLKSVSEPQQFYEEAVKVGQQYNLEFTADELKAFIDRFAKTHEGDSPVCIAMNKPAQVPLTDADGVIEAVLGILNNKGPGVCEPW